MQEGLLSRETSTVSLETKYDQNMQFVNKFRLLTRRLENGKCDVNFQKRVGCVCVKLPASKPVTGILQVVSVIEVRIPIRFNEQGVMSCCWSRLLGLG